MYADKRLVRQMVLNLVSNAVKFTDNGGRVEIRTVLLPSGGFEIVVADDGIGIDADALDQVTRPFFQSDADLSRNHDGAGLGLAIVNGHIGAHGGRFVIDSNKGAGTTVRLHFPPERVFPPTRQKRKNRRRISSAAGATKFARAECLKFMVWTLTGAIGHSQ